MGDINPWHILSIVMTAFTGVLTWLGLNQISRINALERDKASMTHVSGEIAHVFVAVAELKVLVRDSRHDAVNRDMAITQRLDNILLNVGKD